MAEVVSVEDPDKKCRIKVNVYDVFDGVPVADLPWATFQLPLGSRAGEGLMAPIKVGDVVRVQFDHGDSRYPVIVGAAQAMPDGVPNLPPESCGGEGYSHKRTSDQPSPDAPVYYEDIVYRQNGALIEITRAGAIRITQMASGSAIELTKDGEVVIHCEKDVYLSATGNMLQEIDGDLTMRVKGALKQEIGGGLEQTVTGDMSYSSTGDAVFQSTAAGLSISSVGPSHMSAGGGFVSDGGARFNNGVSAKSIKSDTTIVAPSIYEGSKSSTPDD